MDIVAKINSDPHKTIPTLSLDKLNELIKIADEKYYNQDSPIFSDTVYDLLRDQHQLISKGALPIPTPITGRKVKLPYWMGSMDKVKPGEPALHNWLHRYPGPYVVSIKLDGVSALYTKDNRLYTRGDGSIGQDISFLLKHLKLPTLPPTGPSAIRAELILPRAVFESKRFIRPTGETKYYENPRNAVSGLVNSLDGRYSTELADSIDFVAYETIDTLQPKISDQLQTLSSMGFKVVPHYRYPTINETELSQLFDSTLQSSPYELDGLILHIDRPYQRNVSGNPEYAVAFKKPLDALIAETYIIAIKWEVGKDEILTPVASLNPVKIDNVEISQVTVHNARRVVEGNLGPGAIVKIIRSGGVIPHIYEVVSPALTGEPSLPEFPYVWTETGANIKLPEYNETQDPELSDLRSEAKISRIYYFLSTLGVEKAGEKTVARIYDTLKDVNKKEPTLNDFLRLSASQIRFLGPKTSETITENIQKAIRRANVNRLVAASGLFGRGIGERKMEMIIQHIPDFWIKYPIPFQTSQITQDLLEVPGFAQTTAQLISSNYEKFYRFFLNIRDLLDLKDHLVPTPFTLDHLARISKLFTEFTELEQLILNQINHTNTPSPLSSRFQQLWPTFSNWVDQLETTYGNIVSRTVKLQPPTLTFTIPASKGVMLQRVAPPTIASKGVLGEGVAPPTTTATYKNSIPPVIVLSDLKGKKKYEDMIHARGARTSDSVTNATGLVVIGDASVQSGKRKKAEEKGIPVVTLDDFVRDYLTPMTTQAPGETISQVTRNAITPILTPACEKIIEDLRTAAERDRASAQQNVLSIPTTTPTPTHMVKGVMGEGALPQVMVKGIMGEGALPQVFTLNELELMLSSDKSLERDELVKKMHQVFETFDLSPKDKYLAVKKAVEYKRSLLAQVRQAFSDPEIRLLLQNIKTPERSILLERMNTIFTKDTVSGGRQKAELLRMVLDSR